VCVYASMSKCASVLEICLLRSTIENTMRYVTLARTLANAQAQLKIYTSRSGQKNRRSAICRSFSPVLEGSST